ncbi:TPA: hypothetical protein EYP70_01070 [Candidatus Bathyarchaeota archaeon]|nr:hypothetical protein [Candidatus Bathyarchaeota archaeon]
MKSSSTIGLSPKDWLIKWGPLFVSLVAVFISWRGIKIAQRTYEATFHTGANISIEIRGIEVIGAMSSIESLDIGYAFLVHCIAENSGLRTGTLTNASLDMKFNNLSFTKERDGKLYFVDFLNKKRLWRIQVDPGSAIAFQCLITMPPLAEHLKRYAFEFQDTCDVSMTYTYFDGFRKLLGTTQKQNIPVICNLTKPQPQKFIFSSIPYREELELWVTVYYPYKGIHIYW